MSPADPAATTRGDLRLRVRRTRWLGRLMPKEVNIGDGVFRGISGLFALGVVVLLVGIAAELIRSSSASLSELGFGFLVGDDWDPVREHYGALPFIFGTIVSSLLALLMAVPVSLGVAIFASELAPRPIARPLGFLVELLAAIPSVVYGLWGIFVLAPWLRTTVEPALGRGLGFLPLFSGIPRGVDMLCGAVILAVMILPTIASVSRDVLRTAPDSQREAALALGATRWEMVRTAVLPHARSGIAGAMILGLGRALGETMAVTMVIGNRPEVSASLFEPSYTMASVIANELTEATSTLHLAALAEVGLVLFGITLLLNVFARVLVWRVSRAPGGAR